MQKSLFAARVRVQFEVDSRQLGLDGADLTRIARGDDQRDYAVKSLETDAALPLTEWVCYHLWRDCGLATPDFAVLEYADGRPPAFGSRFEALARQVRRDPDAYTIAGFFAPHLRGLSRVYPLDGFVTNPDRHGRNFVERPEIAGAVLVCIDFSRAWVTAGAPFGSETAMRTCQSLAWWRHFRDRMGAKADDAALPAVQELDTGWLERTIFGAPPQWRDHVDVDAACGFWRESRVQRILFAREWCER